MHIKKKLTSDYIFDQLYKLSLRAYKENEVPVGTDHTSLRREYRNLYHFIKGGNDKLSSLRRETMFIQMLEGLHPQEAEIISLVKDKQLETQYKIGFDVVKQAYPDIQWGNRS